MNLFDFSNDVRYNKNIKQINNFYTSRVKKLNCFYEEHGEGQTRKETGNLFRIYFIIFQKLSIQI
jgi:hypothetical protein